MNNIKVSKIMHIQYDIFLIAISKWIKKHVQLSLKESYNYISDI